ncbi:hypothetical protein D9M71_616980 [compost metagenome]
MHDGQAIGVHRTLCLLRHEVVHHAEEAGGQEEAYGVMAVPPLDHRIGGAGVDRVGLEQADREFQVVDDVQHRRHNDEAAVEPVAHVDVLGLALDDGAEEHDQVADPDHCQQDVDRPFQLGVFLGAGVAERQGDGGADDHGLPAPEGEGGETVRNQAGLTGALDNVVGSGEQSTATKGEDHQVGVQRAQTSEAGPREAEVELGPHKL